MGPVRGAGVLGELYQGKVHASVFVGVFELKVSQSVATNIASSIV
jgi:hypothetical protein